ncbi:MAG: hypothetical protein Hals2KO_34120 [Halioglobus sp.]
MELAQIYGSTFQALGAMALLMLLQVLVADVVGIRARHTPGSLVTANHDDLLFRTSRTVANTNETIAIFLLATLFCVLTSASPAYTAYAAWAFVTCRALYACCYYANLQIARSTVFGLALLCLAALLVIGAVS